MKLLILLAFSGLFKMLPWQIKSIFIIFSYIPTYYYVFLCKIGNLRDKTLFHFKLQNYTI